MGASWVDLAPKVIAGLAGLNLLVLGFAWAREARGGAADDYVLSLGVLPGAAGLGVLALMGGAGWLLVRLAQGEPGLWPGVVTLLGVPGAVWWARYLWG